jgi:hypothetical protein
MGLISQVSNADALADNGDGRINPGATLERQDFAQIVQEGCAQTREIYAVTLRDQLRNRAGDLVLDRW